MVNTKARKQNQYSALANKIKSNAKSIFLSATPAEYELEVSQEVVEQIIRPTGLLDPITYVYPKSGDYAALIASADKIIEKKPYLKPFLYSETSKDPQNLDLDHFFQDLGEDRANTES